MIGRPVPRVEDRRLLRGEGRFLDDLHVEGALEVAFLRSPHAHARVTSLDLSAARALPGVAAVLAAAEVASIEPLVYDIARIVPEAVRAATDPHVRVHPMPVLAGERVTYVGQPIAMVAAADRYLAEDALALIEVEFEPLEAIVDPLAALEPGAPLVEPAWGDNLAIRFAFARGDVAGALARADVVVEERFRSHRQAPSPIETRGVLAVPDHTDGTLAVFSSTQVPHLLRDVLARALRRDPATIRVRAPDVGGAFGLKHSSYPEDVLVPFAALALGRPLKWVEDRAEHLAASTHGREQVHDIAIAARADGRILAVRDHVVMNAGAYNILGLVVPYNSFSHLLGPYAVEAVEVDFRVAVTNTGVVAPYRGAGRPEAVFAMERAIDCLARELGMEPVELRARNLIGPEQMPYDTGIVYRDGNPQIYDSGDYPALLRRARELVERERARLEVPAGRRVGVGYAIYTEGTGVGPFESGRVSLAPSGRITVATGASSQGQGHRTTLAQIAAELLDVAIENVEVVEGDSGALSHGFGTLASRTAVVAGNAVAQAATELRARILELAGAMLDRDPGELELAEGMVRARGRRDVAVTLGDVAGFLSPYNPARPAGAPADLEASAVFRPGPVTWSAGVHAALVEVDPATGVLAVRTFVVAHDCGRVVNPTIADGQIMGGVMQGIGGAVYERIVYDSAGQLLTGSFMDYTLPTAAEAPRFEIAHMDVPSPLNALGIKGLGEGGAIGPGAAIANAVADALGELPLRITEGPLTPAAVHGLIAAATKVNTVD